MLYPAGRWAERAGIEEVSGHKRVGTKRAMVERRRNEYFLRGWVAKRNWL